MLVSVAPDAATAGDSVTLQGQGFSFVAQENVVAVGDASTVADDYLIAEDGTESLTFTLPDSASAGDTQILVVVEGNASNALPFVVEP
ncbi:MAG TPA: IPT/TIG domain-containing protein [bacterium]|nr:IPT/TIG domain-containing protein [bacterium]